MPMYFISIDLIGPFEMTLRGNWYVLTEMFMLTNYVKCIPMADKSAETVMSTYLKDIYCRLGGSRKILSDNGSEFKNLLYSEVMTQLQCKHMYSFPYRPHRNGRIEVSHKFLKNCIRKFTVKGEVELDEVLNISFTTYNFFPNDRESRIRILLNAQERCIYPHSSQSITA